MSVLLFLLLALFPPCEQEDSTMCYWNAAANGNNAGTSFIALSGDSYIPFTLAPLSSTP